MESLSNRVVEFYELLSSWEHEVVKSSGLSVQQMHTIEVIGHCGDVQMKKLAEKLHVSMGTLTVMIHRLENMKLVKREKNPEDGRSYILKLTKKGDRLFDEHHKHHITLVSELINGFSESERKGMNDMLGKIISNF